MIEIIMLLAAVSAIAGFARGRDGSPWLWAGGGLVGYVVLAYLSPLVLRPKNSDLRLALTFGGFAWLGIVALGARFLLGRSRPKPWGMWVCSNCKMLNGGYAVVCEACGRPYTPPGTKGTSR